MKKLVGLVLVGGLALDAAAYVPVPKPVKSAIEVTAIYYPGTDQMAEWDMVDQTLPAIKPLLGWYDEGNPEAIDWQIKWAVEHGISSFCVDWYWNKGVQRLDQWVKGFYKARYRSYLKWYMNWCNHNAPGAHSTADQTAVTKFWINNYFKMPEYYKDEAGRPLVVVWEWHNLDRDFIAEAETRGETLKPGEGLKYALDLSRRLAREAGLPGIHFACFANGGWKADDVPLLKAAGIEEFFQYNYAWPSQVRTCLTPERRKAFPVANHPFRYPYAFTREASTAWWTKNWHGADLPFWPVVSTGWNDIPRSFQQASLITDRTPTEFARLCAEARTFCEANGVKRVVIGPLNEWQEGSYIEPNAEHGFAMYDALRDVFCEKPVEGWPANVTPADVGCGPYDYPKMERPARTSWDFDVDGDKQGWYRNPYGAQEVRAAGGSLVFFRTAAGGRSRASIRTRLTPFETSAFKTFSFRARLTPNLGRGQKPKGKEEVRLFWGTPELPVFSKDFVVQDKSSAAVPAILDGAWHEYTIPVAANPFWKGKVEELWFDPSDLLYVNAEIDWMRFE